METLKFLNGKPNGNVRVYFDIEALELDIYNFPSGKFLYEMISVDDSGEMIGYECLESGYRYYWYTVDQNSKCIYFSEFLIRDKVLTRNVVSDIADFLEIQVRFSEFLNGLSNAKNRLKKAKEMIEKTLSEISTLDVLVYCKRHNELTELTKDNIEFKFHVRQRR